MFISFVCLQEIVWYIKQQEKDKGETYFADLKVKKEILDFLESVF